MDSLGSEIGQKMRSAVKAKLIELGTGSASGYIDDELPDYVMIMVANKRSRQQMIDDLTLFLAGQTEVFVNWLHQVLQKLEEVTLPAGSAAATAASTDGGKAGKESSGKRKKEEQKKDKKKDKKTKRKEKSPEPVAAGAAGEHTPPHPGQLGGVGSIQEVFANQYIQQAKKTLEIADSAPKKDPAQLTPPLRDSPRRNEFDIPTISEIAGQTALQKHQKELSELEEIQQKIKQAKKQLKEMGSDESEDEDFLNIKANDDDLENIEDGGVGSAKRKEKRKPQEPEKPPQKVLPPEERSTTPPAPPKKKSILERLGSRPEPKPTPSEQNTPAPEQQPPAPANKSNIISLSAHRREERELYIPVFRRKEMEEKAREAAPTRSRQNRSRSRDRDRRRRESSRERSRNRRERERERERERRERRDRERERSRGGGGGGKVSNGGGSSSEVRARIGSRVIVLPPKPEYVEEDELEVPIPSVIKIQPRPQVPKNKQPSKNLLLKAMAEAQRSTAANLKKTISNNNNNNNNDAGGSSSSSRPTRMLIEIPGHKPGGTPPTVDVRYAEEDDDEEIDIVNQVLLRDDDVDEELQQILDANDEYIPEPVTISISGRSDTDSDGYVYVPAVKKASSEEQTVPEPGMDDDEYDPKDPAKNPKFVVTLDGVYKKSSRASPSHTPPPPAATSSKPSIKDRIGKKVDKSPARDSDDRDHQETLKRRKERFSLKAAAAAAAASKRTPSRSPEKRPSKSSSSSSKRSPTKKRSPNKNSKQQPPRASPADLNELLLQRTKELLVDDSVSSSPIYMSKSDYEKIEPNSSSRKRKRVSPIQFELTDDDEEANDSDGEYNHHRDREHRERKPIERRISLDELVPEVERRSRDHHQRDQNERGTGSRTVAAAEKVEHGDHGERKKSSGGGGNNGSGSGAYSEVKVSPTKKIKKLESSRKFDDVPQLLSSVSVPAVDGLLASGVGSGSKTKSLGLIKERCKYFPSCRQGEACEFLHPSTPCKAFPACKFGDSCLYLHPYCKFDKTCHRLDCNYMHSKPLALASAGPSAPPLASSVVPVQNYKTITAKPLPALCKFYPGCTNGLCPYYHPKMCRFGRNCMNKVECNFYHHDLPGGIGGGAEFHEVPSKDKFKWISPFSA